MTADLVIQDISAIELFKGDKLKEIIAALQKEADSFVPDICTEEGRKEIASTAYKFARSRTLIEKLRKEYNDASQKIIKATNLKGKTAYNAISEMQESIRKPLNEFEEKEKARILKHTVELDRLNYLKEQLPKLSIPELLSKIKMIKALKIRDWEEFSGVAMPEIEKQKNNTVLRIKELEVAEQEKKELDKFREEKLQREKDLLAVKKKEEELIKKKDDDAKRIENERVIAEQAVIDAEKNYKKEIEDINRRNEEERKREDKMLRDQEIARINDTVIRKSICDDISKVVGVKVAAMIMAGDVPHVKVIFSNNLACPY